MKYLSALLIIFCLGLSLSFKTDTFISQNSDEPVYQTLLDLGEKPFGHEVDLSKSSAQLVKLEKMGEEIIKNGKTIDHKGKRTTRVSKYYVCTSCHNTEREDLDLTVTDPEARLSYAVENDLPYLQGSTFWGIVNRESWYNDDYVIKYGALVAPAKNNLREAIKLCAVECSQGRSLEEWEIEAILAYYWKLQYKLSDLNLTSDEEERLSNFIEKNENFKAREIIKSKYSAKAPASFIDVPDNKRAGYGYRGRIDRGRHIYELSCLHCHRKNGESMTVLDNSRMVMKWFKKNMKKHSHFSLYEIIRHGTYAIPGHKAYMPLYTAEKMSNQQVEDLKSYIIEAAD